MKFKAEMILLQHMREINRCSFTCLLFVHIVSAGSSLER